MYPNPNKGSFSLEMRQDVKDLYIRVFDMNGKEILKEFNTGTYPEGYKQSYTLEGNDKGIYIVHLGSEDFHIVKKMVVN